MLENELLVRVVLILFAFIPVLIWFFLLFRKKLDKKVMLIIFALGGLIALFFLEIRHLWQYIPVFSLENLTEAERLSKLIFIFAFFGVVEEMVKMEIIIEIDKRKNIIKTINSAFLYGMVAALGFSFVENAFYLYEYLHRISTVDFISLFVFRAIITTAGHMVFSGIFGYYYGMAKFSSVMNTFIKSDVVKNRLVLTGLFIASFMHLSYNYLLQLRGGFSVLIVVVGFFYILFLMRRRSGQLVLLQEGKKRISTMPKKDEDVVLELMEIWYKEGRYVDVFRMCERLLKRDPDNNVVKMFKARTSDKIKDKKLKKEFLNSFGIKSESKLKSVLTRLENEKR